MINTLEIGKYINNILANNKEIQDLNTKVYPLIADNDAKFPFMIYKRVNLSSQICKDGSFQDDVTVEIKIISDKYSVGIQLANIVRSLLQRPYVKYGDFEINDVTINYANEDFLENAFIQTMQFTLKINDN
jgi:hypothetical protein